ncbi:MAG: hypothetical protein BGO98_13145 [Myxococcales bacterium 68-20]|nr:MAG: hypothetical protein BGO98_13145 [Myxococcales bacterium 68-20]
MAFVSRIGAWRLLVLAVGVAATACSLLLDTDQFVGRETASALDAGGSESGLEASVIDADSGSADSGPTYRDEVLADNPLAYYRLGETSGTVALDETGHGHTGTPVAVVQGVPGALASDPNTAISIVKAATSHVALSDRLTVQGRAAFSIEAWLGPNALDETFRFAVCNERAAPRHGYAIVLHIEHGVFFERYVANDQKATPGAAIATGVYSHVVGTYDGTTLRLYVNGVLAGEEGDVRNMPAYTTPAAIGAFLQFADSVFDGAVDEVALYATALAPDRVKAHFDAARR